MENKNYANASLDDIVFEGRNREYGAYLLRKIYQKHLLRGLIIASALFILFLTMPIILRYISPKEEVITEEKIIDVNSLVEPPPIDKAAPPPPPPPPAEPPPPPVQKTIKFTPPVIKKDELVKKEEVPDIDKVKEAAISTKTQEGTTTQDDLTGLEGKGKEEVADVIDDKIYISVGQNPTFPGGEEAMMKFLRDNTKYPAVAMRNGLEGMVVIQFVIDQTGSVTDITVLKPLGGGLTEAVINSVKAMPKWSPGRQNNVPVKVRYTLPYRFSLR